jgi:hypothetical protein
MTNNRKNKTPLIRGDGKDELRKLVIEAEVVTPHWQVGSDNWLEHILEDLWPQFIMLRDEIKKDAMRSEGEAQATYEKWLARLQALNPEASGDEIDAEAKLISELNKSAEERIAGRYLPRLLMLYTQVTIISAALCEADINLALAWGLSMADKEDVFQLIEANSTVKKWLNGPKMLLPAYQFPPDCAEAETLRRVFSERNRLVHPKATVSKAGKKKLDGSPVKPVRLSEMLKWIARYFSLPFDLANYLRSQPLDGNTFPLMTRSTLIEQATQHRLMQAT